MIMIKLLFPFIIINLSSAMDLDSSIHKVLNAFEESPFDTLDKIDRKEKYSQYDFAEIFTQHSSPLGVIGNNFQRFYIHIEKVNKVSNDKFKYTCTGKTRVKNTICSFTGIAEVIAIFRWRHIDTTRCDMVKGLKDEIVAKFRITFVESSDCKYPGKIEGSMVSKIIIDKDNLPKYDGIGLCSDFYNNNIAIATWISRNGKISKKCNWGDYRIPEADDLDGGTGDFHPNDQYLRYGWDNYDKTLHEIWWK
jgi:hypothetical protein